MNSTSLFFIVSPKLILLPYFLTFMAYSCSSTNTMVVGVRVGVRVKVKINVKIKVKGYIKVRGVYSLQLLGL